MLTALTPASFENVQVNAGVFVLGVDPAKHESLEAFKTALSQAVKTPKTCLGATRGGGSFAVTKETRTIEADGRRYGFKGDRVVDSMDAVLSTTLIEIIPENLEHALAAADIEDKSWCKAIMPRTEIKDEDYIDVITWVGDTNKGYIAITLYNALNTADFNYGFTDKGEGTLPLELHAHQGGVNDYDKPPFAIYVMEE